MILSFILVSGSIKDLSKKYGVSYPTMRQRLDSLIERVQRLQDESPVDPVNDYLADLISKGRIAATDARRLRELHRDVLVGDRKRHEPKTI